MKISIVFRRNEKLTPFKVWKTERGPERWIKKTMEWYKKASSSNPNAANIKVVKGKVLNQDGSLYGYCAIAVSETIAWLDHSQFYSGSNFLGSFHYDIEHIDDQVRNHLLGTIRSRVTEEIEKLSNAIDERTNMLGSYNHSWFDKEYGVDSRQGEA